MTIQREHTEEGWCLIDIGGDEPPRLPPRPERENLRRNDHAKLIFRTGGYVARMWVQIRAIISGRYRGA